MADPQDLEFIIDAYTPETIPMAKLAQYLADLATMLGHKTSVHLIAVEHGSVRPKIRIDGPDVPKVNERIHAVRARHAPPDAMRAYRTIDDRLARDNARGSLVDVGGREKVIEFPGKDRIREIQPFSQPGTLDGIVVTLGGKDNPPTVHLQDEKQTHICHANRDLIRRIAPYIYADPLRVSGMGRWERTPDGDWILSRFTIHDFKPLIDVPLTNLIQAVRTAGLSDWGKSENPLADLERLRHGE
jgi:hypothetical protein